MSAIAIGGRTIGAGHPVFIIAEVGVNHNGRLDLAIEMIERAAAAGADAVKFQNWVAEDFISDKSQLFTYRSRGEQVTEPFYDLCKRYELPKAWLPELAAATCRNNAMLWWSAWARRKADHRHPSNASSPAWTESWPS